MGNILLCPIPATTMGRLRPTEYSTTMDRRLTMTDNDHIRHDEEVIAQENREAQKDAIMKKHQFFSSWIHTKVED